MNLELNSLHGQATLLAALVSISPKLLLGYPARLVCGPESSSIICVAFVMLQESFSYIYDTRHIFIYWHIASDCILEFCDLHCSCHSLFMFAFPKNKCSGKN